MPAQHFDLYGECVKIGAALDNHESDLYIKATPEARELVKRSGWYHTLFRSAVDGETWIEAPFAYLPWWEARQKRG
jgi:hypothetical protein